MPMSSLEQEIYNWLVFAKGDLPGHVFHGNQYQTGEGGTNSTHVPGHALTREQMVEVDKQFDKASREVPYYGDLSHIYKEIVSKAIDKEFPTGHATLNDGTLIEATKANISQAIANNTISVSKELSNKIDRSNKMDAKYEESQKLLAHAQSQYTGWNRFYAVPDGHIHLGTDCHTWNNGKYATENEFRPEMSGMNEEQAVQYAGNVLCTHCFPSAPVGWTGSKWSGMTNNLEFNGHRLWADVQLPNADLSHMDTMKVKLNRATLDGANISNSTLTYSNFSGAKGNGLNGSNSAFRGTSFQSVKFQNSDFKNTVFSECTLKGANFQGADLRGVTFHDPDKEPPDVLENDRLRDAGLHGSVNEYTFLSGTNFKLANLEGADFRGTIPGYSFIGAGRLRGGGFTERPFVFSSGIAKFDGANLRNTDFRGVRWTADPSGRRDRPLATFKNADLSGAKVEGADLSACNFTGAKNLDKVVGTPAFLPEGWSYSATKGIYQNN